MVVIAPLNAPQNLRSHLSRSLDEALRAQTSHVSFLAVAIILPSG